MNGKAKTLSILMVFYIIVIALAVVTTDFMIALVASASFFSLSVAILTNEGLNESYKNRPAAMLYSFIPGIGHIYLHRYRTAMSFSLGYLAIICLIFAMAVSESEAISPFMAIAGTIICMEFMSLIDVERVCNKLQLPYTGYAYELRIKNYNLAYLTTLFTSCVIGATPSIYTLTAGNTVDWKICITIVIAWSLILIAGIIICAVQKRFSDDGVCTELS